MNPFQKIHSLTGALRLHALGAVMLAAALTAAAAESRATLHPGEPAPAIARKSTDGKDFTLDSKSDGATLLVFVKPADRYTSDALRALERMFDKYPPLLAGTRIGIIVTRAESASQVKEFQKRAAPRWPVIADTGDELYKAYRIVATPTVLIIDGKRLVAATHPGYDLGLADDVRAALAKTRGITLPDAMTDKKPAKPNMELQLARRLAARGLWESALDHYATAAKHGPLPPETQLEIAGIHIEMDNLDAALTLLGTLPADLKQSERARALEQRVLAIKAGQGGKPKPPIVNR